MSDSKEDMEVDDTEDIEAEDGEAETKNEKKHELTNPDVVTKYRFCGEVVNGALAHLVKTAAPGMRIVELCSMGDTYITEAMSKVYSKIKDKGIGFPTCVSVNNTVGHFSPLATDQTVLKQGDVIKIDLGAHIDGFVAMGAHTFVLNNNAEITGRPADVMAAVLTAADVVMRLLKPGIKNTQVTDAISKVANQFKVAPVQGVLSHIMQRFVIDGDKVIMNKPDVEQKVDEFEFAPNEVYGIDIVMSSGDGKPKEVDERTTVYKRAADSHYMLKMQASRAFLSDVDKRFTTFPFTLRALDEKKARFGIKECLLHDLVYAYPVLQEKEGDVVAQLKFTVLILPTGTLRVTGLPFDVSKIKAENKVEDQELKSLLNQAIWKGSAAKKNKKKKKKPSTTAAQGTPMETK